jgi:hypothetical protein
VGVDEGCKKGNDGVDNFGVPQIFWIFGKAVPATQPPTRSCLEDVVLFTHLPDWASRLACRTRLHGQNLEGAMGRTRWSLEDFS